jgi:hypothetical protein
MVKAKLMDREARAAYDRLYRETHKAAIAERKREYKQINKVKIAEQMRNYYQANKAAYAEYHQTPQVKKNDTIASWKHMGVIHNDFETLYNHYKSSTNCQECGKEFAGEKGDGLGSYRCLDHCHTTGAFRGVVCNSCNQRRGP